jgi:hypothetical protein
VRAQSPLPLRLLASPDLSGRLTVYVPPFLLNTLDTSRVSPYRPKSWTPGGKGSGRPGLSGPPAFRVLELVKVTPPLQARGTCTRHTQVAVDNFRPPVDSWRLHPVFTFRPNAGNTARTAGRDPHCENLAASEAEAGDQVERVSRSPRRPPTDRRGGRTYVWGYGEPVADLPIPELIENRRPSIAMLAPGARATGSLSASAIPMPSTRLTRPWEPSCGNLAGPSAPRASSS